jgi:hypothetical protein
MSKPTSASVTEVPCAGHLDRAANDPDSPITFNEELNEFNLEYSVVGSERKGRLRIYHCPFCGGTAPKSKRRLLFAAISNAEERRLRDLVKDVQTVDDAIAILGPPDLDRLDGQGAMLPEGPDTSPTREWFRVVTYTQFSETADLRLTDFPGRRMGVAVAGKYLGRPSAP